MAQKKTKRSPKKKARNKIHFSLSWSGLITSGLLALVALVWAFILGVLVGRGYHPESVIPQVARLLPGQTEPAPVPDKKVKDGQVLKPEELGFFESLQQEAPSKQSQPGSRSSPGSREGRSNQARTERKAPEAAQSGFRYVYQVAAFQSGDQARTLSSRLEKAGLSASVTSVRNEAGHWYRVHVAFQGQPSDTSKLKEQLRKLGCPKPFLRSKTPL
jgi:cell division protein FtsN